ncbi:MAG: DUF262 domain-containing protein [Planctomycetes bacterium]|nr:DUF262 domain-containing protein [Planctomycetota bacterium]
MKISHKTMRFSEISDVREDIHLNPAWQRGPVWTAKRRSLLIDSVLRGYDIPMLYLRECRPGMTYQFEVVDGQQRLRALWDFIDDGYPLDSDLDPVAGHSVAGLRYSDLPNTLKKRINRFRVVVAYVKDAQEPELSRLFSRMQMGVRLNPPELRNAIQSGLRHAVDGVARLHSFFQHSQVSAARFKHQDYLAHAVSICVHDARRDLKAPQLMDDYLTLTDDTYAPVLADADAILTFLAKVNDQTAKRLWQKWMFVDLFYLLYKNKNIVSKLSAIDFAKAYAAFDKARLEHTAEPKRLLANRPTKVQKDLYDYITRFKLSGGHHDSLRIRHNVLKRRFQELFGA